LNPHALRRQNLNLVRLPISPYPHLINAPSASQPPGSDEIPRPSNKALRGMREEKTALQTIAENSVIDGSLTKTAQVVVTNAKKGLSMTNQPIITACRADLNHGLWAGSKILTLGGEVAVEMIAAGDKIITRSGARPVRAIHKTLYPLASVVCIRTVKRVLDPARATISQADDLRLSPDQGIYIRQGCSNLLAGDSVEVIAARDLATGQNIGMEPDTKACLFALIFEKPEVIYANGLEIACPAPATDHSLSSYLPDTPSAPADVRA
jgi:hypothetical protein